MARERPKPLSRYPKIKVKAFSSESHPVFIKNRVIKALCDAGLPETEINRFTYYTQANDMEYVMDVIKEWVTVVYA